MKKITSLFFLLLFGTISYSQYTLRPTPFLKSAIIFKNGDSINGYTRLASSAFSIKFKSSLNQKREKKIKYKEVEKIITFIDSIKPREFFYKHTDEDKFLHFVKLIHFDTINIYLGLSNDVDLYYSNSGIDRRTIQEINNTLIIKYPYLTENKAFIYSNSYSNFYNTTLTNSGAHFEFKRFDFFLEKHNQNKLILIGTKGNFMYKNFKKSASIFFEDCPKLVEKISNKEYKLDQLPEIIEFYKVNCN